jgi:hypothetical protein
VSILCSSSGHHRPFLRPHIRGFFLLLLLLLGHFNRRCCSLPLSCFSFFALMQNSKNLPHGCRIPKMSTALENLHRNSLSTKLQLQCVAASSTAALPATRCKSGERSQRNTNMTQFVWVGHTNPTRSDNGSGPRCARHAHAPAAGMAHNSTLHTGRRGATLYLRARALCAAHQHDGVVHLGGRQRPGRSLQNDDAHVAAEQPRRPAHLDL